MRVLTLTLATVLLIAAFGYAQQFDDRGVWHPVTGVTLATGASRSFGVLDVSDMDNIFTVLVSGTGDSMVVTLTILGMMSPNIADTAKSVTVYTSTSHVKTAATAFSDTLEGATRFPYLYGTITNADADSTLSAVNLWLYMQPRELVFSGKGK